MAASSIAEGSFTKEDTQTDVDKLSAGARGQNKEDPETVMTDLKGSVQMTGGIAHFSDLSFGIPGAQSQLHGTYDLLSHKIDLHGQMQDRDKDLKNHDRREVPHAQGNGSFFKKKKKERVSRCTSRARMRSRNLAWISVAHNKNNRRNRGYSYKHLVSGPHPRFL